mmetsp:Transcript_10539/g.22863  ORF Transcript_10539/g.22863 Transcript_10539/m.22863 type:complete len:360 (+) Transcript_10539:78-1157(+)
MGPSGVLGDEKQQQRSQTKMCDDNKEEENKGRCVICDEPAPFQCSKCSKAAQDQRCETVGYCSKEHQLVHWKTSHKVKCGKELQPVNQTDGIPLCDLCHERPCNDSLSPEECSEEESLGSMLPVGILCMGCGAKYCGPCTLHKIFKGCACVRCSLPCPECAEPLALPFLLHQPLCNIERIQVLSDGTSDHKNKAFWHLMLGSGYEEVLQDETKAIQCYEIAGSAGIAEAYDIMGTMYHKRGDFRSAKRYYELATRPSDPATRPCGRAYYNLAMMYGQGHCGAADFRKATDLFVKAADLGNREACSVVGTYNLEGNPAVRQIKSCQSGGSVVEQKVENLIPCIDWRVVTAMVMAQSRTSP